MSATILRAADRLDDLAARMTPGPWLVEENADGDMCPPAPATRRLRRGKDLACCCPLVDGHGDRYPCHADVLLDLANREA